MRIRDKDRIVAVNINSSGQPEFAGPLTLLTNSEQESSIAVEYLYGMKQRIHDIDMTEAIRGHSLGPGQGSGCIAGLAEVAECNTVGRKSLNSKIQGVADQEIAIAILPEKRRVVQGAGPFSTLAIFVDQ